MRLKLLAGSISAFAIFFSTACFAQLTWEKRQLSMGALPGSNVTVGVFPFTNTTGRTITVKEVKPSCKCLVANASKKVLTPGETGNIEVTVDHERRTGVIKESIMVVTDDTKIPYDELLVTVKIAKPIEASPAFVMWKVGDAPQAKEIRLSFPIEGTEFLGAKCESGAFEATHATVDGSVVVSVLPKSTDKQVRAPMSRGIIKRTVRVARFPALLVLMGMCCLQVQM